MKCDICGEIIDHQGCCPDGCTNCPIYGNRNSTELYDWEKSYWDEESQGYGSD